MLLWATCGLAVVVLATAALLAIGGVHLVSLGGSPYYVLAGAAFAAGSILVIRRSSLGIAIIAIALVATIGWAFWEAGPNGWALMPRIVGPLVTCLPLLWLAICLVKRRRPRLRETLMFLAACGASAGLGLIMYGNATPNDRRDPLFRTGFLVASDVSSSGRPAGGDHDWPVYGKDAAATRYSSLSQLNPSNVDQLELAWVARVGPTPNGLETTPIKVGETLYLCTNGNDIVALDAETGRHRWRFNSGTDLSNIHHPVCRGVAYYSDPLRQIGICASRILMGTLDGRLIAVDAGSGKPCEDFGNGGIVSLLDGLGQVPPGAYGVTSPPTLVRGKVVVGAWTPDDQYLGQPSGVIRAYDAVTGRLGWAWDAGRPDRTSEPLPGETYTRGTPNAWAPMSADEDLGLVYVPTGAPTPDWYGAHRRPFDDAFSNAVVAIDADSGRPRWVFQTTRHDLWDYDLPSAATLLELAVNGEAVKALIQPTKTGELFILNRETGKPLFPVTERGVPISNGAPNERISPTQPFSESLPSFGGPFLYEKSMWGITPLDQLWCRIRFRQARYEGIYTPPGLTPIIASPGYVGGMEWGGIAVDPGRGLAIINSNSLPNYARLISRKEASEQGIVRSTPQNMQWETFGVAAPMEGTPYAIRKGGFFSPLDIPCSQPPFGRLSALDLKTGKLVWTQPFGSARGTGPFGIRSHLPLTIGTPNIGGAVTTSTGLAFIGATPDRYLRAFDIRTGNELWRASLPASGNATPITYLSAESGRQFVVIAAGSAMGFDSRSGDWIVAFARPHRERVREASN